MDQLFKRGVFMDNDESLNYRIYAPDDCDKVRYPLILFLHGAGERGDDNEHQISVGLPRQMFVENEFYREFPAIVVVPQCPAEQQWVDTPWEKGSYSVDEVPESSSLSLAFRLTEDIAQEYNADRSAMFVTGLSMGGYGAWDLLARHSGYFSAAVIMCGAGDPEYAEKMSGTRIAVYHGSDDTVVPPSGMEDMKQALEKTDCEFTTEVLEGFGHGVWDEVYGRRETYEFLFKNVKEHPPVEPDDEESDTGDGKEAEDQIKGHKLSSAAVGAIVAGAAFVLSAAAVIAVNYKESGRKKKKNKNAREE